MLIRKSESKLVFRLFSFEFFQGAAIAIYYTTAIAIFLEHLPTDDLPKVFILSAILLWIAGYVYSIVEHKMAFAKLVVGIIIFNAACVLLFRLFMELENQTWYLYLLLAMFNIIYLLNNLEFWGLAALLFDVRQSKRLFAVVSAGDIPAKMVGYLLAVALVPVIGTENLLWVALGCLLLSLLIFRPLQQHEAINEFEDTHEVKHGGAKYIYDIGIVITGNKLIRHAAMISFFSFCCLIVVNFVFYGYVKHAFSTDKSLAGFFAIFLAIVRGITMIIKITITNKMADRIGLKASLLITPVLLAIITFIAVFFIPSQITHGQGEQTTFYIFGVLAIVTDVLRSAIQSPVLLATMQPLPAHQRLKGHTIIKGLTDPFAFMTIGILLLLIPVHDGVTNFKLLCYILLGLIAFWILYVNLINNSYLKALSNAIRNRTLNGTQISITDKESLDILLEKLKTGNESDAFSVLQLIASQKVDKKEFFEAALLHPSAAVQNLALQLIKESNYNEMAPALREMLSKSEHISILPNVINTLVALNANEDLTSFILHPDELVSEAAIAAQLNSPHEHKRKAAMEMVKKWFSSSAVVDNMRAAKILSAVYIPAFDEHILKGIHHYNDDVKQFMYKAAGLSQNPEMSNELIKAYPITTNDREILEALLSNGNISIPVIRDFLLKQNCHGAKSRKLISVLGKMQNENAALLLDECLQQFPAKTEIILPALIQNKNLSPEKKNTYIHSVNTNLSAAADILFKVEFLQQKEKDSIKERALQLELNTIRYNCLYLFELLYNTEKVTRAAKGFELNTKDSIANALELIMLSVPKPYSVIFITVYENSSVSDKCGALQKHSARPNLDHEILFKNILFDIGHKYSDWTKSCFLYDYKNNNLPVHPDFIKPFTQSGNAVLQQTAAYILQSKTVA